MSRTYDNPHAEDLTAGKRGQSHQLLCSRRASDAVRMRAHALGKPISSVLDEAIKLGLLRMPDPYREQPIPPEQDEDITRAATKRLWPVSLPWADDNSSAASSRHGAQRDAATGVPSHPHETPAPLPLSTDEETP